MPSEFLSRKNAASLIDSSDQLIDKWIKQGLLKAYYAGPREQSRSRDRKVQTRRKILVKRSDLLALL